MGCGGDSNKQEEKNKTMSRVGGRKQERKYKNLLWVGCGGDSNKQGKKKKKKKCGQWEGGSKKENTKTYYSAESLSWYSRARLKHSCTPGSFHKRFMIEASSADISPSSAVPASERNCRASSYQQSRNVHVKSPLRRVISLSAESG